MHSEGQPYYVTNVKGFCFITEADVRSTEVNNAVWTCIQTLGRLFFTDARADAYQPGDIDFVIEPWGAEWGYYIANHLHKSVFWLHANDVQWITESVHGLRSLSDFSE